MSSLLDDAFAHHIWATERLIDACATLTREQLVTSTPGTYGPIMATLAHLVSSDGWYLSFFREQLRLRQPRRRDPHVRAVASAPRMRRVRLARRSGGRRRSRTPRVP